MALTIHGSPRSRTMRTLWMAAELGLDYALDLVEWTAPDLKAPAFLALNPAGQIPTLEDDGFVLAESLAINLYLAKKYGRPPLYPGTVQGEAEAWRWTLWAQGALEPWVQRDARMEPLRAVGQVELDALAQLALDVLERALSERAWLCGPEFSVADLNVACVLSPSRSARLDLVRHARVGAWLERCYARPAAVAARARHSS
jgi:glutathione S-transferase